MSKYRESLEARILVAVKAGCRETGDLKVDGASDREIDDALLRLRYDRGFISWEQDGTPLGAERASWFSPRVTHAGLCWLEQYESQT
jgi:hypothetical protein